MGNHTKPNGKMIKQVQRQTTRMKEKDQARALQSSQPNFRESDGRFNRNLSLARSKSDHPMFSCSIIPWPKDPAFHGRDSILAEIHKQSDRQLTQREFRYWDLCGVGGRRKIATAPYAMSIRCTCREGRVQLKTPGARSGVQFKFPRGFNRWGMSGLSCTKAQT